MKKFWWENKKDGILIKEIYNSYLIWNMPFWANLSEKADMLDVKNVDFPMLKYRIHSQNYANNEIGKFNLLNGELRTLTRVMKFYEVDNFEKEEEIDLNELLVSMTNTDKELEQAQGDFLLLMKELTSPDEDVMFALNELIRKMEG